MSSCEGSGLPDGWLWATITDEELAAMASLKTSRGWTMLESRLPTETSTDFIIRLRASSKIAQNVLSFSAGLSFQLIISLFRGRNYLPVTVLK